MLPDRHTAKAGIRPRTVHARVFLLGFPETAVQDAAATARRKDRRGSRCLRWLVLLPLARVGTGPGRLSGCCGCHHCGGWLGGWVIDGPFACAGAVRNGRTGSCLGDRRGGGRSRPPPACPAEASRRLGRPFSGSPARSPSP